MRPASTGEGTALLSSSSSPSQPSAAHAALAAAASAIHCVSSAGRPAGVRFAPSAVSESTWAPQSRASRSPRMPPSEKPSTWHSQTPSRLMTSMASLAMSS